MAANAATQEVSQDASTERIRKLSTFICAQNYFILPALVAWLRAKLERRIGALRFVLSTAFLLRLTAASARATRASLQDVWGDAHALRIAAYAALATLSLQLVVCLYYLAGVMPSGGFVFMVSCLYLITQMNVSCMHFFLQDTMASNSAGARHTPGASRLSRKDILGRRTISNMNLI